MVWHVGMDELSGDTHVIVEPWQQPRPWGAPMRALCERVVVACVLPPDDDSTVTCNNCHELLYDHVAWCQGLGGPEWPAG